MRPLLILLAFLLVAAPVHAQMLGLPGSGSPGLKVFSAGGGGVTGSGAANQCAYFSGATALAGDADCTFDGTTFAVTTLTVGTGHATPATNDGAQLGTALLMWSDLFLASLSVINWNNGDVTLTHAANTLTLAGGDLIIPAGTSIAGSLVFGSTDNAALSAAADVLYVIIEGQAHAALLGGSSYTTGAGLRFQSDGGVSWTASATDANTSADTFVGRAGVGVVEVNNGTAGTFRDLITRSSGFGTALYGAAPIGTVGSGTGVTVNATGDLRRATYKATFTYAAFSAAATTADKTIYTLAAKQRLVGIIADVTVTFTGGAVSDADMTCGKTAGGAEYLVSFDVDTATSTRGLADADLGTSINRAGAIQGGDLPSWTATTAVQCRLTTVGANTDALTAGTMVVYLITEMM